MHLLPLLFLLILPSCREDEYVTYITDTDTGSIPTATDYNGMYLLNEGNMGSNKCTLDYLDLSGCQGQGTSHYYRNIYSARNPQQVLELGDVGNDIQVYGSKLWIVVNCSNKVEVCNASDARRIGQINIANCRYIVFDQGFAYISSYAGPRQMDEDAPLGRVYKVDTLTLQKVDSVTVGYQPEEMAVVDDRLYVANSGGYRMPKYDNRMSVINLREKSPDTMQVKEWLTIAPNLHRVRADRYGQLWVSSRGDYNGTPSRLFCFDTRSHEVTLLDQPVSELCIVGDTLYYIGSTYRDGKNIASFGLINVRTHQRLHTRLFDDPAIQSIVLPYGLIVNPRGKDFYLMDAKNYVSSGELLHFLSDGTYDWRVWTGDIPSRACFANGIGSISQPEKSGSPYIQAVDEYVPAPGQFINTLPQWQVGDDATAMAQKCTQAIAGNAKGMVCLGSWGGYVTFHFDHPVLNEPGQPDFCIWGNAHEGNSEPGIVMVSQDINGNHLPDDPWYEISGSADTDSIGRVRYGYEVRYSINAEGEIVWQDGDGNTGIIERNTFHEQPYFPQWLPSPLTLHGTRLPDNAFDLSGKGNQWTHQPLRLGYADNVSNQDTLRCAINLDWAVTPIERHPIHLTHADFIRVYSGCLQSCGWLGETSTEICGALDLHPELKEKGKGISEK